MKIHLQIFEELTFRQASIDQIQSLDKPTFFTNYGAKHNIGQRFKLVTIFYACYFTFKVSHTYNNNYFVTRIKLRGVILSNYCMLMAFK